MKHWLKENRGFLLFLVLFGLFRTAIADWNPIPSGSMRPTLLEGDVVLVNRVAFDLKVPLTDVSLARLGEPRRGDVVTFSSPADGTRLIKRIVGLPGDTVELKKDRLFINGVPSTYTEPVSVVETTDTYTAQALRTVERMGSEQHTVQFLPGLDARRDFGPVVVPADSYFCLGDNRDNSADSRYIGMVPRKLLIGRAHHVLVSADVLAHWAPRVGRWGRAID